ncbi:MAG: 3'-5' exonuclease [Casimicrobiaceae bacterium]|nr:3'-5' exonuclease [Casimicrobiaceae bacterium]
MRPILVFDLETVPDVAGLRRLHDLPGSLSDAEVAQWAFAQQRAKNGGELLPFHLQRVCAIACVLREGEDRLAVWSLGDPADDEAAIIGRFFELVDRKTPQLVSWNGGGFDLPVLLQRGLIVGARAPQLLETGANDRAFNFDHYLNRYKERHLDLMDFLALYQPRANAPLDAMAKLCGLPGKLGLDGTQVWPAFLEGRLAEIRAYCETDALNTYLLYLRFLAMRGTLDEAAHRREQALVRAKITALDRPHWREFLAAWS